METEPENTYETELNVSKVPLVINDLQLSAINNTLGHFEEDEELKYKEQKLLRRRQKQEAKLLQEIRELEEKKERARKSMCYLLGRSMMFSDFFDAKLKQHTKTSDRKKMPLKSLHNNIREPNLEDMLKDTKFDKDLAKDYVIENVKVDITDHLKYFKGSLRQYQIEGLTWMTILYENGVNGILADEMGLGKTVQVIALLCHLYEIKVEGPFLIIAPLSTIPNWSSEFKRFAPNIPVVVFQGILTDRESQKYLISKNKFKIKNEYVQPVIITTYQIPLMENDFLNRYCWKYIIIDEGHRIKNINTRLAQNLRKLRSVNRLLLTGTPIHNNLTELWALLNFLLPHIFTDMEMFTSLFAIEDIQDKDKIVKEEETTRVINTMHKILAPFMLRRLKCDVLEELVPKKEMLVYCPITKLQRDLYTYVIQKNLSKLKGEKDEPDITTFESKPKRKCTFKKDYRELSPDDVDELYMEDFLKQEEAAAGVKLDKEIVHFVYRITMQNTMMMFRKIVNHPYLVHFPLNPNSKKKELLINEKLITESGKMLVLDAMLAKLKARGHKVLLFSTLVMMIDLIEDYLIMRNYTYCRLDGSYDLESRRENIEKFNTDPNVFIFILSTRSGGLGLNLTAADTVILYDRDWNPQVDIQAQDRCHRIGQEKPIMVYTLVTKNTIDEKIIKCGIAKRRLEKIVIKDGKFKSIQENKTTEEMNLQDLKDLLDSNDCSHTIHSNGYVFTNKELDELLDRTELYEQWEKTKAEAKNK